MDILPNELVMEVLEYLSDIDIQNFALICKEYAKLIKDNRKYLISKIRSKKYYLQKFFTIQGSSTLVPSPKHLIKLPFMESICYEGTEIKFYFQGNVVSTRGKIYPIGNVNIIILIKEQEDDDITEYLYSEILLQFNSKLLKTRLYPIFNDIATSSIFTNDVSYIQFNENLSNLNRYETWNWIHDRRFFLERRLGKFTITLFNDRVNSNVATFYLQKSCNDEKIYLLIFNINNVNLMKHYSKRCLDSFFSEELHNIEEIILYKNYKYYAFREYISSEKDDLVIKSFDFSVDNIENLICPRLILKDPIIDNIVIPGYFEYK